MGSDNAVPLAAGRLSRHWHKGRVRWREAVRQFRDDCKPVVLRRCRDTGTNASVSALNVR